MPVCWADQAHKWRLTDYCEHIIIFIIINIIDKKINKFERKYYYYYWKHTMKHIIIFIIINIIDKKLLN
jgi:hypothetical protein